MKSRNLRVHLVFFFVSPCQVSVDIGVLCLRLRCFADSAVSDIYLNQRRHEDIHLLFLALLASLTKKTMRKHAAGTTMHTMPANAAILRHRKASSIAESGHWRQRVNLDIYYIYYIYRLYLHVPFSRTNYK